MTPTTLDNQVLAVISLGKLVKHMADDGEADWGAEPCNVIICRNAEGRKVELSTTEVKHFNQPYTFATETVLYPIEEEVASGSYSSKEQLLNDLLVRCCAATGISPEELQVKTKKRTVTAARGLFCYLACKLTSSRLKSIGDMVNLPHDMVIYYRDTVRGYVESGDRQTLALLEQLTDSFT